MKNQWMKIGFSLWHGSCFFNVYRKGSIHLASTAFQQLERNLQGKGDSSCEQWTQDAMVFIKDGKITA